MVSAPPLPNPSYAPGMFFKAWDTLLHGQLLDGLKHELMRARLYQVPKTTRNLACQPEMSRSVYLRLHVGRGSSTSSPPLHLPDKSGYLKPVYMYVSEENVFLIYNTAHDDKGTRTFTNQ